MANAWDHALCVFSIEQGNPDGDNWLGNNGKREPIAPGGKRTFNIKPGVYHITAGFCDGDQFIAASGTYGAETATIEGPSLIAIGPNTTEPVAGTQTLAFTKLYNAAAGGGVDQAPAEATEPPAESSSTAQGESKPACKGPGEEVDHYSECCSGRATMRGTLHNGGTRVCCTNDTDCVATE